MSNKIKNISYNDHYENYVEGWGIFFAYTDTMERFQLQRVDDKNIFADDNEAIIFVVNQSIGNLYSRHSRAISFLAEYSPEELNHIRDIVGSELLKKCLTNLKL